MDIFKLYQSFQSRVNTFQGGWFRPETDFARAVNDVSNELWEMWTRQAEKSIEIKDNLSPFLRSVALKVVPNPRAPYGKVEMPEDKKEAYGRFSSARIRVVPAREGKEARTLTPEELETEAEAAYDDAKEYEITLVDNQRWAAVNEHQSKMPTLTNPKMTHMNKSFYVAPRGIGGIVLDYYVKPKEVEFAYNKTPGNPQTGAGDQLVYTKNDNTELEWSTTVVNEFLVRLGERYGVFTRDQFMAQISNAQKTNP